jgi:hypothetical protein
MKKLLILLFLTACGTDVKVDCPEVGCVPVNQPVPEAKPTNTPTPAPIPAPVPEAKPTPTVEVTPTPEPEDHTVNYVFKYSSRETPYWVQDVCDDPLDSFLNEGDDATKWLCGTEEVYYSGKAWTTRNFLVDDINRQITKTTFNDFKLNSDCKVTSAKAIKCTFTDNYIEVYADVIYNLDEPCYSGYCNYGGKIYEKLTWKVYYWPEL